MHVRTLIENTWVDGNGKTVVDWIVLMTGVVCLSVAVVGTLMGPSKTVATIQGDLPAVRAEG